MHWKLRTQYGRNARHLARLTEADLRDSTAAMFLIDGDNPVEVAVARVRLLGDPASPHKLPGVGVPVASAIAALTDPARCCVVDFRGWRAVFGEERSSFTSNQYRTYVKAITDLAGQLGWGVAETDIAAWALDAKRSSLSRAPVCRL